MAAIVMPSSNLKVHIAEILKEEGFIVDFMVDGDAKKELKNFQIEYTGTGNIVLSQSPSVGSRVSENSVVRLLLSDN